MTTSLLHAIDDARTLLAQHPELGRTSTIACREPLDQVGAQIVHTGERSPAEEER